jgi:hypothetical protein
LKSIFDRDELFIGICAVCGRQTAREKFATQAVKVSRISAFHQFTYLLEGLPEGGRAA